MAYEPSAARSDSSTLRLQPEWLERAEAALSASGEPFSEADVRRIAYQMRDNHEMPFLSYGAVWRDF